MMKNLSRSFLRRFAPFLSLLSFISPAVALAQQIPDAPREFRAMWIATVENIDWPSKAGLSSDQQQAELIALLDLARNAGLNAVILQIRPAGDALYNSRLEPWSSYLSGRQGVPPSPAYDPLEFAVTEAHRRGLELHAWFNPYRAKHASMTGELAASAFAKTHPQVTRRFGKFLWMDPGEKVVQDHVVSVITDVVRRYDIDAVHFDDYFYPYKSYAPGQEFPDEDTFKRSGTRLSKGDWRRDNVNTLVRRVGQSIRQTKPHVRFGISPFGIWRPGNPAGITGMDAYNEIYNDSRRWLAEGWVDYLAPQLYWPTSSTGQNFGKLLGWWSSQNQMRRHLWPGLITDWIGSKSITASEIATQINLIRRSQTGNGHALFSAKSIRNNKGGITAMLRDKVYGGPALVPATTWIDSTPPAAPTVRIGAGRAGETVASWDAGRGPEQPWLYGVYRRTAAGWRFDVLPAGQRSITLEKADGVSAIAVTAIDRLGNESAKTPTPVK